MNLFRELFSALSRANVRYLVVGGVAANLHGIERATGDIDLVIDLDKENVLRFIRAAEAMGLVPKAPVALEDLADTSRRNKWREDKGMLVFSLYDPKNPYFLVGILTEVKFDFEQAYGEREKADFGGIPVSIASINTLIGMKEATGRPQDEADVHHLRMILEERDD